MDNLLIVLLECFYIIYMLCYFKTYYSIAHPLTYFSNDLFYHPIGKSSYPKNMICKFGHFMAVIISIFLIVRYICFNSNKFRNFYLKYHKTLICILFILCLINFNALLYMIPIFILEVCY